MILGRDLIDHMGEIQGVAYEGMRPPNVCILIYARVTVAQGVILVP